MLNELMYPFDSDYLMSNKRRIKKTLLNDASGMLKKRIAILGGSTTSGIKDMLDLFLLNQGIEGAFYESEYNKYYEDAVFSNDELDEFKPEVVYIFTSFRNLDTVPALNADLESVTRWQEEIKGRYLSIWSELHKRFNCVVIQNNFEMPNVRLLGNYDVVNQHGLTHNICKLNSWMSEQVEANDYLYLCDLNYISAEFGLSEWYDNTSWYMYKYALNLKAIPTVAFNVSNIIKAIYGKNKKGFVVDLDNTLWGGVVGDVGQEGIEIGSETALGQAYLDFQKYLKKHKEIGIILNIDSKNDEENAKLGLNHPQSALSEDDFIVIKANWENKDKNYTDIAAQVNIAPESLVFVDDNPAERMIVSEQVKGVCAPDIGRVTDYIGVIDKNGFFETVSLSSDDAKRNEMYKENAKRAELQSGYKDYGEYLQALNMNAIIEPFDKVYLSRIAQLTNKSNQFNLTTKRYSLAEIEAISENKSGYITLYGSLKDRFGDNGVVSVIIGKIIDKCCKIELWLMSCRVLKRDMECAMMDELVDKCIALGIDEIIGIYIPSQKNKMVENFYKERGFLLIENSDGITKWRLDLTEPYQKQNKYIKIGEN